MNRMLRGSGAFLVTLAMASLARSEDAGGLVGAPCGASAPCEASLHCVDGYCCTSLCGPCGACDGRDRGWSGAQNGSCAYAPPRSPAVPPCSNGSLCHGDSFYCPTQCTSTELCADGYYCGPGSRCTPKVAPGEACPAGCVDETCDGCSTGICADGVCCRSECAGACVACTAAVKGGGDDGVCGPVAAGRSGRGLCAQDPVESCGQTGRCDGAGKCSLVASGVNCSESTCAADDAGAVAFAGTYTCDGHGSCAHHFSMCAAGCDSSHPVCAAAPCGTDGGCDPSGPDCSGHCGETGSSCVDGCDGAVQDCTGEACGAGGVPMAASSNGTESQGRAPVDSSESCGQAGCGGSAASASGAMNELADASGATGATGTSGANGALGDLDTGVPSGDQGADAVDDWASASSASGADADGPRRIDAAVPQTCGRYVSRDGACLRQCDTVDDCVTGSFCLPNGTCGAFPYGFVPPEAACSIQRLVPASGMNRNQIALGPYAMIAAIGAHRIRRRHRKDVGRPPVDSRWSKGIARGQAPM